MNDDEMKLYRAFMAAQLQAAPKKTPEQEAAEWAAMRQAPYQYGEGHQNINAVLMGDEPGGDWYHDQNVITVTGWQRLKRWVHDRHLALWWRLFGRLP